jgi:hypothetical protein
MGVRAKLHVFSESALDGGEVVSKMLYATTTEQLHVAPSLTHSLILQKAET